jgi:CRISPR-associated protein Cst2
MAPRSIVARLSRGLVAGFDTYGFNENGEFPELARIKEGDLPGAEFWIGGELVRAMPTEERERLLARKVHLHESPQALLSAIADKAELGKAA